MLLIMVFGYLEEVRGGVYIWGIDWTCLVFIYLMYILYIEVLDFFENYKI